MSDPVTNVEIEDVLSSIRRLVSDGDKARTRDPAPIEAGSEAEDVAAAAPESPKAPKPEKFVLTPAFMIVDNEKPVLEVTEEADVAEEAEEAEENVPFLHRSEDEEDELSAEPDVDVEPEVEEGVDPAPEAVKEPTLTLGEPLVEDALETLETLEEDVAAEPSQPEPAATPIGATDRSSLVATIAELEAAVSSGTNEYELDGSEVVEETIAWPGTIGRAFEAADVEDAIQEAPAVEAAPVEDLAVAEQAPDVAPAEIATPIVEDVTAAADEAEVETSQANDDPAKEDVYSDDDLDGLLDVGGVAIDEEALKDLVAEVVRAELTGPLGERITRNVRKLVRREIYRILSSQDFD